MEGNDPVTMARRQKKYRVAEIFGPTIQGEGRSVGMPCHFIRFGGCDFRCTWCDTPHAVLPDLVAQLPQMSSWEILDAVHKLDKPENDAYIRWVVLTGGNPALLDLEYLIGLLHLRKYSVMLETQGSVFRSWFGDVDDLCFSPKPPSAGNTTHLPTLARILEATAHAIVDTAKKQGREEFRLPYLKIPIFSDADLDYAEEVHRQFPSLEMFLSIGNTDPSLPTVGNPNPKVVRQADASDTAGLVLDNFKTVLNRVLKERPALQDCRIFPQQHTLLWGNERGR